MKSGSVFGSDYRILREYLFFILATVLFLNCAFQYAEQTGDVQVVSDSRHDLDWECVSSMITQTQMTSALI